MTSSNVGNEKALNTLKTTVEGLEKSLQFAHDSMTSTVLQSTQMVGVMNDLMETLLLNCLSVVLKVRTGYTALFLVYAL
jgi:hypothetical protein